MVMGAEPLRRFDLLNSISKFKLASERASQQDPIHADDP